MEESIFESIKSLLGPDASYDVFDQAILIHINTAISVLTQLGVGPKTGFSITGPDETWSDLFGDSRHDLNLCKDYIYMYVKIVWDPSASGTIANAMEERMKELTYRIILAAEVGGNQ
jgi:hypothetical protein